MTGPNKGFEKSSAVIDKSPKKNNESLDPHGLKIEKTTKNKYHIIHEGTSIILPFVLQGEKEAINMKYLLGRAMIVQETCEKNKKFLDSCRIYPELSPIDGVSTDLYVDNNPYFILGDTGVMRSEELVTAIQGEKKQHSMKDGAYPFAQEISTFLNNVHTTQIKMAKSKTPTTQQVAQK